MVTRVERPARAARGAGRDLALGLISVAAAGFVYAWLPRAYFSVDDLLHLYDAGNLPPLAFILQPHGGYPYVVRNFVFELTLALAGPRPEWFMATALATHVLNVGLLFVVIRRFTGSALLACLGALLWGTAPDAAATIGWYSIHGQALATTVLLLVLASVAAHPSPTMGRVLAWVVLAWLGAGCSGSGLAFAAVLPIVLVLLVPGVWQEWRTRALLIAAPAAVVAMALVDPVGSELGVPFGRVLTDIGVLVGRGVEGLVALRPRPLESFRVPALLVWGTGCALYLWRGTADERRRLLAFLVTAMAAYAAVAVGMSFDRLLATEPRHQYYAQAPLVVTMCLVVARAVRARAEAPRLELVGAAIAVGLLVVLRASFDPSGRALRPAVRLEVEHLDGSLRTLALRQPDATALHFANAPLSVLPPVSKTRLPGAAALFCILHPDGTVEGRPVYFVDADPEVLAAAAGGRCSGRVLVGASPPGVTVLDVPSPPTRRRQRHRAPTAARSLSPRASARCTRPSAC